MATHDITAGQRGSYAVTLTANTVDTFNFTDEVSIVEVVSDGAAAVYVTVDGTTPTVAGASTYEMTSYPQRLTVSSTPPPNDPAGVVVKVISAGTPKVSVAKAPV